MLTSAAAATAIVAPRVGSPRLTVPIILAVSPSFFFSVYRPYAVKSAALQDVKLMSSRRLGKPATPEQEKCVFRSSAAASGPGSGWAAGCKSASTCNTSLCRRTPKASYRGRKDKKLRELGQLHSGKLSLSLLPHVSNLRYDFTAVSRQTLNVRQA